MIGTKQSNISNQNFQLVFNLCDGTSRGLKDKVRIDPKSYWIFEGQEKDHILQVLRVESDQSRGLKGYSVFYRSITDHKGVTESPARVEQHAFERFYRPLPKNELIKWKLKNG